MHDLIDSHGPNCGTLNEANLESFRDDKIEIVIRLQ